MELTENQMKYVELAVQGVRTSEIAKRIGISRQVAYRYVNNPKVKAELDRRLEEIKEQSVKSMNSRVSLYISELEKIALTSESEKLRADTLQYLIDRVLGKTTSKTETTYTNKTKDKVDITKELEEVNNIVDADYSCS